MAKMRLLWNNLWDHGTLTESTEAADYPVENTQHIWRRRVFRTTAVAAQWVECDMGAPVPVSAVVIENHNIPAGSTVQFIGAAAPAGADVTYNLDVTPDRIVHFLGAPETYRYWRVYVDAPPDSYTEIGRIFIGQYVEFNQQYAKATPGFVDPSQAIMSDGGQVASNQLDRYKRFNFQWSPGAVSQAEYDYLYLIFTQAGIAVPYWIVRDADAVDIGAHYVLNQGGWQFDPLTFGCYGFSLDVEEAR